MPEHDYSPKPQTDLPTSNLSLMLLGVGVMIISLLLYLPTVAPTITWLNNGTDSGDFAAAVATLGIPHPPGYPTYVLLGRAWIVLPLGGDIAYRLNLLSAVSAGLAAGVSAVTIIVLGRKLPFNRSSLVLGSVLASLALAIAPIIWSQATITEVYAPGLAMLSLMTLCLVMWWGHPQKKWLILAGVIGGLSFGVLPQLILAAPGVLFLLYAKKTRQMSWSQWWRQWIIPATIGAIIGLSTFIYLPVRAAAQPFINWGNPGVLSRFWVHITAQQYQQFWGLLESDAWLSRLWQSLTQLGQQLSWAVLILALFGIYFLWHNHRALSGHILTLVGLTILFRTSYPVVGNIVYLVPALYGLALAAGVGIAWLLATAQKQIGYVGVGMLTLVLFVALFLRAKTIAVNLDISNDQEAALFSQQVMEVLPPNAIVISDQDETTFSLWYRQSLGQRSDVLVVDRRLLDYGWYQQNLRQHGAEVSLEAIQVEDVAGLDRSVYVVGWPLDEELIRLVTMENQ